LTERQTANPYQKLHDLEQCALSQLGGRLQDGAELQQALAKVAVVCVSDVFVLCELLQSFINMDEHVRQRVVIIDGLGSLLYSLQGGSSHHHRGVFLASLYMASDLPHCCFATGALYPFAPCRCVVHRWGHWGCGEALLL
jgi:hypothetical protein